MSSKKEKQRFVKVIDQNQGLIFGLCKLYYREEEDQKDTFQEIILRLWKSFSTFQGKSKISTWIYKVSLNTILNKIRKEKRQIPQVPIDDCSYCVTPNFADDHQQRFLKIISYLNEIDKAILLLYLDQHSYKEIASTMNLSVTNISSRINRIKIRLRQIYENKNYEFK